MDPIQETVIPALIMRGRTYEQFNKDRVLVFYADHGRSYNTVISWLPTARRIVLECVCGSNVKPLTSHMNLAEVALAFNYSSLFTFGRHLSGELMFEGDLPVLDGHVSTSGFARFMDEFFAHATSLIPQLAKVDSGLMTVAEALR